MIDSSVDLPQPEGPDMATYSPLRDRQVHARERMGLNFVGVKYFGQVFDLDQGCACFSLVASSSLSKSSLF